MSDSEVLSFLLLYVLREVGPVELPSFDFDEWLDRETEGFELNMKSPAGSSRVILSAKPADPGTTPGVRIYEDGVLTEEF